MIFLLFEFVVMVTILSILVTQVIAPLWRGTLLFPYFRKRKLVHKLEQVREQVEDVQMESLIASLREEAKAFKKEAK